MQTLQWMAIAVVLYSSADLAIAQTFPQGVASGDVTQTSAVCWTRVSTPGSVRIDIAADDQFQQIEASSPLNASDAADKLRAAGDAASEIRGTLGPRRDATA